MMQTIEITVEDKKYQIEWAISEHFGELRGKKYSLSELAADRILLMEDLSEVAKILLSAVAGAVIQHLIDNGCSIESIFEKSYLVIL